MEPAIEITNQKILLANLRNDIIEASTTLTKIHKDIKVQSVVLSVLDTKVFDQELAIQESGTLLKEQKELTEITKTLEGESKVAVKRFELEVEILKVQKKEAMTELKRLNEWVFTAKVEEDVLNERKAVLEANLANLDDEKTSVQDSITLLKEKYVEVVTNIKLSEDANKIQLEIISKEALEAEIRLTQTLKEQTKAEEALLDTENKRLRITLDLEIYTERTKKEYEKMFPDRIMKL